MKEDRVKENEVSKSEEVQQESIRVKTGIKAGPETETDPPGGP